MTEYLPYATVKFKIKSRPKSWLSIAFSDIDLMLQFCLPDIITEDWQNENGVMVIAG